MKHYHYSWIVDDFFAEGKPLIENLYSFQWGNNQRVGNQYNIGGASIQHGSVANTPPPIIVQRFSDNNSGLFINRTSFSPEFKHLRIYVNYLSNEGVLLARYAFDFSDVLIDEWYPAGNTELRVEAITFTSKKVSQV